MQVTVLGSGTAIPNPDRFPAGYLVRAGGRCVLVDLGPGVLRRAIQAGVDLGDIDAVLLTHYHTDHCADLAALLFGLRNRRYAAVERLRVVGAPGLRALHAALCAAWPWLGRLPFALELDEIEPGDVEVAGLGVTAVRVEHTDQSLGFRLTDATGHVAAFSGDAVACPGLEPLAAGADLFVCDSAFPTAAPGDGHMTATEAGLAAAAAGCRRLLLTHFYPECEGHDLAAEARAVFGGDVRLAADLDTYDLDTHDLADPDRVAGGA
ncbi:MAG: ribonuclease Z [Planctomycetes bacterium]|nr:ribonuclease Z [Planctomycetota bacterium]